MRLNRGQELINHEDFDIVRRASPEWALKALGIIADLEYEIERR